MTHKNQQPNALNILRTKTWNANNLPTIIAAFDLLMMEAAPPAEPDSDKSELLFDILMTRFDVMEPYKTELTMLSNDARKDPAIAYALTKSLGHSLELCFEYAGITTKDSGINLHKVICLGSFGHVFFKWCEDFSPDSATTMSALNRVITMWKKLGLFS